MCMDGQNGGQLVVVVVAVIICPFFFLGQYEVGLQVARVDAIVDFVDYDFGRELGFFAVARFVGRCSFLFVFTLKKNNRLQKWC